MNETKFLVIGSNSFSGSHFVKEVLDQGNKVIGVSRSQEPQKVFLPYKWTKNNKNTNFNFYSLDINKDLEELINKIKEFEPQYVVNFASQGMVAESWLNPIHWYKTNLLSQVEFHDEIRKMKFIKKYVHISTPEVYGDTEDWIKENHNFNPTTPYSVSRAACDMHLLSFYKAYDFPVIFTRAANVYGPGQQLYRIIPRTLLSLRTKKPLDLHGGGYSKRSFIHINDVVKATYNLALKAEPGSCWHISTNEAISIRDLVKKMCEMTNSEFNSIVNEVGERLGKDKNYLLNSDNLRSNFNWSDKISLHNGIEETMSWIDQNLDLLNTLPWEYVHKA